MSYVKTPAAYVVDTSVAVKWIVERDEAFQVQALGLLKAYLNGRCVLHIPEFLVLEFANALSNGGKQSVALVLEALEYLRGLSLQVEALSGPTLARAVEFASSYRVAVYDCYFLALAVDSGSTLVTADEAFLRRTGSHPNIVSLRELRLPATSASSHDH